MRNTMMNKLAEMKKRMDALYAESFKPEDAQPPEGEAASVEWEPAADIAERDDSIAFFVDLPGVPESHLTVEVAQSRLVVRGRREAPDAGEGNPGPRSLRERPFGAFRRVFAIPDDCRTESVRAELKAGVLSIRIPRHSSASGSTHKVVVRSE